MKPLMEKAHTYDPKKHIIPRDWYWSEKLDGLYFLWDGGITRGMLAKDVPWANCFKDKREHISTGMWSSQGKVVYVPDELAEKLPPILVEGERTCGRGTFQETASRTKSYDGDWDGVELKIFGAPLSKYFLSLRKIEYMAGTVLVDPSKWQYDRIFDITNLGYGVTFRDYIEWSTNTDYNFVKNQLVGDASIKMMLDTIVSFGGEGLILRSPHDVWMPVRSQGILKYKPFIDDEAVVVGATCGKGKYEGMIGAIIVRWQNRKLNRSVQFELSGMTDEQRSLHGVLKEGFFKVGDIITFRYRELSNDGVPKEARFLRKRED